MWRRGLIEMGGWVKFGGEDLAEMIRRCRYKRVFFKGDSRPDESKV